MQVVILGSGIPKPQLGLHALSRALSQKGIAKMIQVSLNDKLLIGSLLYQDVIRLYFYIYVCICICFIIETVLLVSCIKKNKIIDRSLTLLLESPMLLFEQVIAKARVPIIKFVEKKSGISFDIRYCVNLLD